MVTMKVMVIVMVMVMIAVMVIGGGITETSRLATSTSKIPQA
jgi:hypothetical protein